MATASEFTEWLDDFTARYPSVGDYVNKHDMDGRLVRSWCESLAAYDLGTLDAVTAAIIQGSLPPVDTFRLGYFADEIRNRARQILDAKRRESERERLCGKQDKPAITTDRTLQQMMLAAVAADRLCAERGIQVVYEPSPTTPYGAAIVLADQHTAAERQQALATLERYGVTWEQIDQRSSALGRSGLCLLKSAEDV